jgi:hypothetical protein
VSDFFAACTPNSLPENGRAQHGYQLTVLSDAMTILETVDLPEWKTFQQEEAETHLARIGYVLSSGEEGLAFPEWSPAGLGFMASVVRADGL